MPTFRNGIRRPAVHSSPDKSLPRFQQQQLRFTAHVRDPGNNPLPDGVPARRMAIYTEIFFNNVNDQLSGNFPVLRQISSDERWTTMVRDFMRTHRSATPLFTSKAVAISIISNRPKSPVS